MWNGRSHEVDFADAKIRIEVYSSDGTVEIVVEAVNDLAPSDRRRFALLNIPKHLFSENRLPRGRTYVRNGSVFDSQITRGKVAAAVSGSDLYTVTITIAPVTATRWKAICRDCAGTVDSLVELLQGRLAKGVMDRVCREGDGLFPSPTEIKLSCSCPDWADMCKHIAAALYGVGARLDEKPQLLFVLRDVDETEMLASAGQDSPLTTAPGAAKVLDESEVAALFGLEMAETPHTPNPAFTVPKRPQQSKAQKSKISARKTEPAAKTDVALRRTTRASSGTKKTTRARARKRRSRRRP